MARYSGRRGFSLVEVMVVVTIISLLAMIAVPTFGRIKRKAKIAVVVGDFRVFAGAFDTYSQEMGKWPADSAAGVFPTGMDDRINKAQWRRITPLGGQYNWEYRQLGFGASTPTQAAIAISTTAAAPFTVDATVLTDLEGAIDGSAVLTLQSISGGTFRAGSSLNPFYVIAP